MPPHGFCYAKVWRALSLGSKAAKLLRSKSHTLVPANFGSFALGSASAAKLLRSKSQAGQTLLRKIAKLSMRLTTFRQTGLGALNPFGVTGPGAAHALLALALALAQLR